MSEISIASKKVEFKPTKEQALAISHHGSDLLISAGAGSGKTATLTDRIVSRICEKKADISRMLVVTYTKDAANELKVRITKKIAQRLKNDPKNPHLSSQIIKVTSADISTIHSFCLRCLRPHFDKLGLDSDFRIGEESELAIVRQDAMTEVLDSFYEAEVLDPDFLLVSDCYSEYTDETTLDASLLELYTRLSSCAEGLEILLKPIDIKAGFLKTPYGQVLLKRVERVVRHFLPIVTELYKEICGDDSNSKYMATFEELYNILLRLDNVLVNPSYEGIKSILKDYTSVRIKGGRCKNTPTVDTELLGYIRDDVADELKDLRDNYFYSTNEAIASTVMQNEKNCKAIYKILKAYEKEYTAKKRKYSLCDFNDLERYTLRLFYNDDGGVSPIALEIGQRYDELYIDEYQDVNSIQDKIFSAISRNNRFMVGDIKQSIYSFRSAEPELFSGYRDSFSPYDEGKKKEGKTIFMSDNFRCDPGIISLTNHVSDYMFFNSRGFNYVSGDRLKNSKLQPDFFVPQNSELCLIDKSSISKNDEGDSDPQAEFVAQEIRRLLDTGYLPSGEKIEPKHIAILLRKSANSIEKYIDALNKYGIKNEYVQEISFFEKPHVLLMLCILNSIDNPSRDVYLAGAMYSHIWDFSLEELITIKRFSPKEYSLYSALNSFGGESGLYNKVKSFLEKLNLYRESIRKMSAEEAISYVMNETGFLSACGKEERRDIIKLYNLAREYEQGSYKGLYSFLRYIDNTASQNGITETVSSDPENSVRILTMHKSKGLEYEICFLCDTEKLFSKKSYTSPILFQKDLGICGYVSREGGIVKYNNILRKCASLAIKEQELEESLRLLYVAMTRARSKLYITASMTKVNEKMARHSRLYDYKDEYTLYSYNNHIDIIMGACPMALDFLDVRIIMEDNICTVEKTKIASKETNLENREELKGLLKKRLNFKYEYDYLEKLPSKLSISTLYPQILDSDENEEYTKNYSIDDVPSFISDTVSSASPAERGTATHVFLQFCDFENLQKNGVECELTRLTDNAFISKAVGDIINKEHIEKFISSEMMKEFLCAKSILREFRFNVMLNAKEFSSDERLKDENVLVQGVTDCIYENSDGELILVDYKTDNVTEENYVSELTKRHKIQLSYYKKACEMMFERPVSKVLIYSVPLAKTVEIK